MCRPAAVAPARTHSAERRACSGVSQLKSTASATSPARRHIWGPSAATTRRTGSSDRSAATPSRTRLRAPGFGLPTPRRRRPRGSALAGPPWTMLSGPRVWRGIPPIPSSIRRVSVAASASAASPSVAPGWFTQKELYPSPSASRADARMISGAAPEIIRASAREAEGLGYSSFWVNHPGATDGLAALALAATETRRIELGIGGIPLHTRGPDSIVQGGPANALPLGRLLLGVGSPNPGALKRVRDGVAALRPNL